PDNEALNRLIREAKINLLPTFQNTGIKHKLLNALANGGYCLANTTMVEGTGLEELCQIANTPSEWKEKIRELATRPNNPAAFEERTNKLKSIFDLERNARLIRSLTEAK